MRKAFLAMLVLLVASASVDAAPRHWYSDARWWAGEAVIVGSVIADGRSTCTAFGRGEVEWSILARGTTSCKRITLSLVGAASAYTVGHAVSYKLVENDPSRTLRTIRFFTVPAVIFFAHGTAAIHNYQTLQPR